MEDTQVQEGKKKKKDATTGVPENAEKAFCQQKPDLARKIGP